MKLNPSRYRVYVVDDDPAARELLARVVRNLGYRVESFGAGEDAIRRMRVDEPDVLLCDVEMPNMDGYEVVGASQSVVADLPVILVTGFAGLDSVRAALRAGAYDYLSKPLDLEDLSFSLQRAIERRQLLYDRRVYEEVLEQRVLDRTRELSQALENLEQSYREKKSASLAAIISLSKVAEINDEDTGAHVARLSRYSGLLAATMGMGENFIDNITYSAPMHDIGKVAIPPAILKKPGPLSPEEFDLMKTHTTRGAEILEGVPFLEMATEIALGHHERFDGHGYPAGREGEDIPLAARIVAVSDVFDALVSRRCYKEPFRFEEAVGMIVEQSGAHFDPKVVAAFERVLSAFRLVHEEHRDRRTATP